MTKKDLVLWPGSGMGRFFETSRFGDMLNDVTREIDRVWQNFDVDTKAFVDCQPKTKFPKINVSETDDSVEVEVALAGFEKEDIGMELKENTLYIKADKREEVSDESKKYLLKEISSRSFRRAINLPNKVRKEEIDCSHKDGIITCVFKKDIPEEPKEDIVKIDILD